MGIWHIDAGGWTEFELSDVVHEDSVVIGDILAVTLTRRINAYDYIQEAYLLPFLVKQLSITIETCTSSKM